MLYEVITYKDQNYKIAIDDAGAGYSGLNLISDIKPHFIRITSYNVCYTKLLRLLIMVLFVRLISRPIKQVEEAIDRLGKGDFKTPVAVGGAKDLVSLGERLDWTRNQLAEVDRSKTKFVSRISHELKTPLASIREGRITSYNVCYTKLLRFESPRQ